MKSNWRDALPYYPLLPAGAFIALVWAGTAPDSYFRFAQAWAFPVNEIGVALGLAWLTQELLEATGPRGPFRSWRQTSWAIAIGVGGAIAAAATYVVYVNISDEPVLMRGWPVVCGVDVFFGVALARAIFRRGAAVSTVIIVALVGDVMALLLVSRRPFVSNSSAAGYGVVAFALVTALLLRRSRVRSIWAYLLWPGTLSWFGCYWAGLHPALSLLPITPFFPRSARVLGDFEAERHSHAHSVHFEAALAYPLQLVALLFGLVNAGVLWRESGAGTWAVITASLVGRPIGVLVTAALLESGWTNHLRWSDVIVISFIGSVGSVFALFLATAVFPDGPVLAQTKLGAIATLAGVVVAGLAARVLGVGRFMRRRHA